MKRRSRFEKKRSFLRLLFPMTAAVLLLTMVSCGKQEQGSNSTTTSDGKQISSSASTELREEDCPKPEVGVWWGEVFQEDGQRVRNAVAEIHEDGSVTLFGRDVNSHSPDPVGGDTFTGDWTLLKNLENEMFKKSVVSHFIFPESFGMIQKIAYAWKFHSPESRPGVESSGTTLYFVFHNERWIMVDADVPSGIPEAENDIFITRVADYPKMQEKDCPKPSGAYQTNVLFYNTNKWEKVNYLDVQEDGSVILYYWNDRDMEGIEMKGRWTLWANLRQEGSYDGGDVWTDETKYVWRFDSDESYSIGHSPNICKQRIWLLFCFKENGNLWLLHNMLPFEGMHQLRPAD